MEVLVGARQSITINNSSDNGDSKTTATAGAAAAKSQKDGNRMARMDGQMDRWDRQTDGAAQEISLFFRLARLGLFRWETTLLEAMSLIPSPLNLAPVHANGELGSAPCPLHSIHGITIRNPLSEIRDPSILILPKVHVLTLSDFVLPPEHLLHRLSSPHRFGVSKKTYGLQLGQCPVPIAVGSGKSEVK
ncbi:GM25362 [Drosophila sechellia]|uniref:GM25362 n=1 Tax=Drosophila sechellia TaxID=7238 RepID=B4HG48_DROSE|nr:GM25362 [Drosophila sechellia]